MEHTHWYISDLHIGPDSEAQLAVLDNLCTLIKDGDRLTILGDFFTIWLRQIQWPTEQQALDILKSLTDRGIYVAYMRGNRDALMQYPHLAKCGVEMLGDPHLQKVGEANSKRVFLTHGDAYCRLDWAYLNWRRKLQSPAYQAYLATLSDAGIVQEIHHCIATEPKTPKVAEDPAISDVTPDAIRQVTRVWRPHLIIHGHTHRTQLHQAQGQPHDSDWTCPRAVLGQWDDASQCVVGKLSGELFTLTDIAHGKGVDLSSISL